MRRLVSWVLFAAVLGLAWPAGALPALGQEAVPPPLAPNATPRVGQRASATGLLVIKYGDPERSLRGRIPHQEAISLKDDLGRRIPVEVGGATQLPGALHALNGTRVTVVGDFGTRTAAATGAGELVLQAEAVRPQVSARAAVGALTTGTVKWATLLCRFPDDLPETVAQYPISYFPPLIVGPKPSAEHYWKENSRDSINFNGSTYHGWNVLPKTRATYLGMAGGANTYLDELATDCAAAAKGAEPTLDFNGYGGVNVMLSKTLDGSAWGGFSSASIGGVEKDTGWPVTWLPEFGYRNQNVTAHEMGHAFRLPHSSGPYNQTYDSKWDVMSDGGVCRPENKDVTYGCLGDHTMIYHKDFLGWIPAERRFIADGTSQTITLERSAVPTDTAGNVWIARIPIGGSQSQFYTLEARKFTGYDVDAPAEGVVIHKVNHTPNTDMAQRAAQVVDVDNNGNPNDAAAVWTVGETFTDAPNNITVSVLAATATGYQVRIGPNTPPVQTGPTNVRLATRQVAPGRLEVTVNAVTNAGFGPNTLRDLRFGVATNAVIDVQNGPSGFAGGQTVQLPGNPASAVFFVNRVGPGPFMIRLEVGDGSGGTWRTFVGGGNGVQ